MNDDNDDVAILVLRVLMLAATQIRCPVKVDPASPHDTGWHHIRLWMERARKQSAEVATDAGKLAVGDIDAWLLLFDLREEPSRAPRAVLVRVMLYAVLQMGWEPRMTPEGEAWLEEASWWVEAREARARDESGEASEKALLECLSWQGLAQLLVGGAS